MQIDDLFVMKQDRKIGFASIDSSSFLVVGFEVLGKQSSLLVNAIFQQELQLLSNIAAVPQFDFHLQSLYLRFASPIGTLKFERSAIGESCKGGQCVAQSFMRRGKIALCVGVEQLGFVVRGIALGA